jgi:hypothetical protein
MTSPSKTKKMSRQLKTKKQEIREYWADKMFECPEDLETCWGCGITGRTQRCHIQAVCDGGTDSPDNLMLLCKMCHIMQETICGHAVNRTQFIEAIKDGAPFMTARLKYFMIMEKYGYLPPLKYLEKQANDKTRLPFPRSVYEVWA